MGPALAAVPLLALLLTLLGGCVTAREVEQIVADANRESLVAGIADATPDPQPGAAAGEGWEQAVARIEDYIVNHPDQPRTINALRIREAVLLLNAGQPNLARAVFDQVDPSQLAGARDLAIYDAREHLAWWYGLGRTLTPDDRRSARDALAGLAAVAVADGLGRNDATRRFLEETRVRIGLRLAASLSDPGDVGAVLDDATTRYAAQFDAADRRAIQAWHRDRALAEGAALKSLRWYDYVPAAFARADEIGAVVCHGDCKAYTPGWVACIRERGC
jgi:hypothetical protein